MTSPLDPRLAALINPDLLFAEPEKFSDMGFWHEHIPFAFVLMDLLAPQTFVELGAHKGDSYFAFCQAVAKLGLPTRCYAVDTWQGDVHTAAYDAAIYAEFKAWHDARYAAFSTPLRMTFDEAATKFAPGSIDLLHIDGTHTYEAVKHDFETWLPKMSERGVILFHDVSVRRDQYGVWKLWQEISGGLPHFEFTNSNGLGVLGTGSALPEKFRAFLGLAQSMPDAVHGLFEAFGQRVARGAQVNTQAAQIGALEKTRDGLFRDLEQVRTEFGNLGKAHAMLIEQRRVQDERIAALLEQIATTEAELAATQREVAETQAELSAVYQSNSWKITAPVRWLKRLLHRG